MELILKDNLKIVDAYFGQWICGLIRSQIIRRLNKKQLAPLNELIRNLPSNISKDLLTVEGLIQHIVNNFECCGVEGNIVIKVNSKPCPGFISMNNNTLAKLINYGNLECKGSYIFTDTFDYVKQHLSDYISYFYDV